MRSGQAAIEFLLSYGYAILGLLAVLGVLGYFAGAHTYFFPDVCSVNTPFACVEVKASEDGEVILGIQNVVDSVEYTRTELHCDGDPLLNRSYAETDVREARTRLNGSYVRFSCPGVRGLFRAELRLDYRVLGESVEHTVLGSLRLHAER